MDELPYENLNAALIQNWLHPTAIQEQSNISKDESFYDDDQHDVTQL